MAHLIINDNCGYIGNTSPQGNRNDKQQKQSNMKQNSKKAAPLLPAGVQDKSNEPVNNTGNKVEPLLSPEIQKNEDYSGLTQAEASELRIIKQSEEKALLPLALQQRKQELLRKQRKS